MVIIVDGYNVLKQVIHAKHIPDSKLSGFVAMLEKYASKRGHTITVVFDGGPCTFSTTEDGKLVTVIRSGVRDCADTVIKRLLREKRGLEALLVSSDRELHLAARDSGVEVLRSGDFRRILQETLEGNKPTSKVDGEAVKRDGSSDDAYLDELMSTTDTRRARKNDEDYPEGRQKSSHKRLSKKEKAALSKLKRL